MPFGGGIPKGTAPGGGTPAMGGIMPGGNTPGGGMAANGWPFFDPLSKALAKKKKEGKYLFSIATAMVNNAVFKPSPPSPAKTAPFVILL